MPFLFELLPFPYSLGSANFAVLSQRETGVKRVKNVGVYPLAPTAVGMANFLPSADGKLFARKDRTACADRVPRKAGV